MTLGLNNSVSSTAKLPNLERPKFKHTPFKVCAPLKASSASSVSKPVFKSLKEGSLIKKMLMMIMVIYG